LHRPHLLGRTQTARPGQQITGRLLQAGYARIC
jgi:hypothetical protein